jgi:hypothetical protein
VPDNLNCNILHMCLYRALNKVLSLLIFCLSRYFNPIVLESDVRIVEFDTSLAYLGLNFHSRAHWVFISVYYVLFKPF